MLRGAEGVTAAIRDEIALHHADSLIHTTRTLCNGRCEDACTVVQYPGGAWYRHMTPADGRLLVRQLLQEQCPLPEQTAYVYQHQQLTATGTAAAGVNKYQSRMD